MKILTKVKQLTLLFLLVLITSNIFSQNVLDGAYIHDNTPKRKFIPYTSLRESDVMWSKRVWRVIDLREKINLPFYYPLTPTKDRQSLIDVIKAALMAGRLTAYGNPLFDEEFKQPLTKTEVEAQFVRIDTNYVEDINNPGTMTKTPVRNELGSQDVKQYLIKEDWFFDKQRSVMDVRIIGICPLKENKGDNGEVRGYQRMFWLYFPEARSVFANAEVYNRTNDAERRTYDDVFWKRQFGSYIVKVSNVYDRTIGDYKTGLDALLEAESIKENVLFNTEHDLWHF